MLPALSQGNIELLLVLDGRQFQQQIHCCDDVLTTSKFSALSQTSHSCSSLSLTLVPHCNNKLVVLATEWLPWLHTSWRDSGYWRVWKTIAQGKLRGSYTRFILQPQYRLTTLRISVKELLQFHFKFVVRNFHALNASR